MGASVLYENDQAVEAVVIKFESSSYALEEFTHARHITVAAWYLSRLGFEQAMGKMRSGLVKFSAHHNRTGYNETITQFWLMLVEQFRAANQEMSISDLANAAVERFGDKNILFHYYSRERVLSDNAKRKWIEPDVQDLRGNV